jgi:hypothetical protein
VNADRHLEQARELAQRVADGESPRHVAEALEIPPGSIEKMSWLARVYPPELCVEIGAEVLCRLRLSHLVVVGALARESRTQLLRRAADEGLSVRALKAAVREVGDQRTAVEVTTIGGSTQLDGAAKALAMYVTWPADQLARLLRGANGDVIRRLAKAGARLHERINLEDEPA